MSHVTRDDLIYLQDEMRMSKEDIAVKYGRSLRTVVRWFREKKVPPAQSRRPSKILTSAEACQYLSMDGETSLEKAQSILGGRLMERIGYGYYLDGKPCTISALLTAAAQASKKTGR